MRRGTLVLLLFVLIVGGIVGVSTLLQNQPPLVIRVAVSPLIRDWAQQTINAFNATNAVVSNGRRVRAEIVVVEDLDAWRNRSWTLEDHPNAWIPASSATIAYAREGGMPFEILSPSVAKTPLVWGAYATRANVLTSGGTETLDWEQVMEAAETASWEALGGEAGWQFLDLAFPLPDETMTGAAVLLSGAGNFNDTTTLGGAILQNQAFRESMTAILTSVPNFNNVGSDTAAFLARRGLAGADIAIAPESQWLMSLANLNRDDTIQFSYPEYTFMFDFPVAMWQETPADQDIVAAVNALNNYLLAEGQQATLPQFGLRPAQTQVTAVDTLFNQGGQYGIQLSPDFTQIIQPPSDSVDIQSLIRWAQGAIQ